MHVIFMAPHFPANQRRYVRGLKNVGAMVTGIGDAPVEYLDNELKGLLDGYEYVKHIGDEQQVFDAVRRVQKRGPWVDRFEATIEAHMLVTAKVREAAKIPGESYEITNLCRDKFVMKNFLRERGIPCAANAEASNSEQAIAFAKEVGFPLILKPRDGAGAHGTYKLNNLAELKQALKLVGLDRFERYFTIEEFIEGHEGFFDTLTVGGKVVFEGICHYYPNVLEGMRDRRYSPQIVTTNRIDEEGYSELRGFGRKVIAELGITTAATHMEWFYGNKGLKFSEIGARPPGCNFWDVYCAANEFDLYTEWARGVCWGDTWAQPSRRMSGGLVSIRPTADGTVRGYSGLDQVFAQYGDNIITAHIPPVGSHTQSIEGGFLANAWFKVRHPDYDVTRAILDDIGATVRMWAG